MNILITEQGELELADIATNVWTELPMNEWSAPLSLYLGRTRQSTTTAGTRWAWSRRSMKLLQHASGPKTIRCLAPTCFPLVSLPHHLHIPHNSCRYCGDYL